MESTSSSVKSLESDYLNKYQIGLRINCNGDFGTIRYVGEIKDYKGVWLGINWDNPSRGKHNGNVNGVSYFTADYETSGSFVRPQKVNLGVSLINGFLNIYGKDWQSIYESESTQLSLKSLQQEMNAPFFQLVGFDKIASLKCEFDKLISINLRDQSINGLDFNELKQLSKLCPNIKALNLSKNLFNNWDQIIEICKYMKNLELLNVSENILKLTSPIQENVLNNLKVLICGEMNLDWDEILQISLMSFQLEEIRCPYNHILKFNSINKSLCNLKRLFLQGNTLNDTNNLNSLGVLNNLEYLVLTKTNLKEIIFDGDLNSKTELFKNLNSLSISDNLINDWSTFNQLNRLENLQELRCQNNPIFNNDKNNQFTQFVITKIGNLKILNGSKISSVDRRGAEIDYLKYYSMEWLNCKKDENLLKQFYKLHPRYPLLIKIYGELEENEIEANNLVSKSTLIELEIINENVTIKKKLPANMTAQKLITLIQRLLKLKTAPQLAYSNAGVSDCLRKIDNVYKELNYYSLKNGDKIFVNFSE